MGKTPLTPEKLLEIKAAHEKIVAAMVKNLNRIPPKPIVPFNPVAPLKPEDIEKEKGQRG